MAVPVELLDSVLTFFPCFGLHTTSSGLYFLARQGVSSNLLPIDQFPSKSDLVSKVPWDVGRWVQQFEGVRAVCKVH